MSEETDDNLIEVDEDGGEPMLVEARLDNPPVIHDDKNI